MPVPSSLLVNGNEVPEHTTVFVENIDTKPHVFKWGKARYIVEPGQKRPVPYHAMTRSCGDPRTKNVPGDRRRAYRTEEFRRLCVMFGVYDDHALFMQRVPKVKVTTLLDEPIVTVLDDPEGKLDDPEFQGQLERTVLEDAVKQMQAQMLAMQAELNKTKSGQVSNITPPTQGEGTAAETPVPVNAQPTPPPTANTSAPVTFPPPEGDSAGSASADAGGGDDDDDDNGAEVQGGPPLDTTSKAKARSTAKSAK